MKLQNWTSLTNWWCYSSYIHLSYKVYVCNSVLMNFKAKFSLDFYFGLSSQCLGRYIRNFSPVLILLDSRKGDKAYHYILGNDLWVFTHRLHEKYLKWQENTVKFEVANPNFKKKKRVPSCFKHTLYPFCSANMIMVFLLSLVVLVASKTWNNMEKQALCSRSMCLCVLGLQQTSGTKSRTHRNLSSFNAQVLPHIIKSWQSALTVERHERDFYISDLYWDYSRLCGQSLLHFCFYVMKEKLIILYIKPSCSG